MDGEMISGGGAAQAAPAPAAKTNVKHILVTAIIGAAANVLRDAYDVPQEEADILLQSARALLNRLFGHHPA